MAIVRMKKVTVVGPADKREWAVEALQDLGLVHVEPLTEELPEPAELVSRLNTAKRVAAALARLEPESAPSERPSDQDVLAEADELLAKQVELETKLAALQKEWDLAEPWGSLWSGALRELEQAGLFVRLYAVPADVAEEDLKEAGLAEDDAWVLLPYAARRKQLALAVFRVGEAPALELDPISPLGRPLAEQEQLIQETAQALEDVRRRLRALAHHVEAVRREIRRLQDRLQFVRAAAAARSDEDLFALQGWCPADQVDSLSKELSGSVALLLEDPHDEEEPPVELRNGPFFRLFEPMIKMFTLPHYREGDPTILVAPFMTLFFGLCLGDGGYGLLITLASLWAERKFRPKGDGLKVVRFMEVLGLSTLVVGVLTGTVFGVPIFDLQLVRRMGLTENSLLFFLSSQPDKFFYASLAIGVFQLTVGMLVKLSRQVRRREFQGALATVGWLNIAPGVGVWYAEGTPWLFVAGVLLIFLFSNPAASVLRRLGTGAWELYNISGFFGDVMSYARLFGLGLSTGIIGNVINQISLKVMHSGIVGWIGGLVILLVGHAFNLSMSAIGSMVHSARLQFLEYYGKFFEGGGRPYQPLRRLQKD